MSDLPCPDIVNLPELPREAVTAHDGVGFVNAVRPFDQSAFDSDLMFVDYVEMPPGTSIGIHRHGADEELYFIVAGAGTMTIEGAAHTVRAGDLILNRQGWSHGLRNDGDRRLRLLVWQVACRREA